MKADRERFETARARTPHWVGNDPLLEIGRARFLVVTARVMWCRPLGGPCTDSRSSNAQQSVSSLCQENVLKNSPKAGKEKNQNRF